MKTTNFIAGVALFAAMTSCGPSQKDAIKYNDDLIAIQKELSPVHEGFLDQFDGHNPDSLKKMLELFTSKTQSSLSACEKLGPFNDKREYLDAAIEYFKVMKGLAENEGKLITEILVKDSTQITEENLAQATQYAGKFDSEYARVLQKVQDAQVVFSKENKFDVVDSK